MLLDTNLVRKLQATLHIQNDIKLVSPDYILDFLIVEVKTGKQSKLNKVWAEKQTTVIEYILRFAGFIETKEELSQVATELAKNGSYQNPEKKYSVRLILISELKANSNWQHLTNILFDEIIDFLVDVRGQCWLNENIGVASIHDQWDDLINDFFAIANDQSIAIEDRKSNIKSLLQKSEIAVNK